MHIVHCLLEPIIQLLFLKKIYCSSRQNICTVTGFNAYFFGWDPNKNFFFGIVGNQQTPREQKKIEVKNYLDSFN